MEHQGNIPIKNKKNFKLMVIITFLIGVILIVASYAWFYASLNVKVRFFNMVVSNNSGLSISFDGINFDNSVEISEKTLIEELKKTYPDNTSQWTSRGLIPVSSNGISSKNTEKFDMYKSEEIDYKDTRRLTRYLTTSLISEDKLNGKNRYIAFDLFLKNITGSPMSDNLYLDGGSEVTLDSKSSDDIDGLVNSMRFGFVKTGSVSSKQDKGEAQKITCNNNCEMVMYEPNSTNHSDLSIENAKKYGIHLINGTQFPTYAVTNPCDSIDINNTISGSVALDTSHFSLQNTTTSFSKPLFQIPDGITKIRVYVWIEGQDIDSLESLSNGASISINLALTKDTAGYDYYN